MSELLSELLFANDCALLANTGDVLQHIVNRFSNAANNNNNKKKPNYQTEED